MDSIVNYERINRLRQAPTVERKPICTNMDIICVAIIALTCSVLYSRFNSKQKFHQQSDILSIY